MRRLLVPKSLLNLWAELYSAWETEISSSVQPKEHTEAKMSCLANCRHGDFLLHKPSTCRIPTNLVRQTNWKFAETSNETCWYMSWNIPLNMWSFQLSRFPSMAPPLQKKSCLPNEKAFTKMKHFILSPLYNLGDQINFFQVNITLHAWLKTK